MPCHMPELDKPKLLHFGKKGFLLYYEGGDCDLYRVIGFALCQRFGAASSDPWSLKSVFSSLCGHILHPYSRMEATS